MVLGSDENILGVSSTFGSLAQSVAVSAGPREVLGGDWGVMGKGIEAVSYCIGVQVRSAVP